MLPRTSPLQVARGQPSTTGAGGEHAARAGGACSARFGRPGRLLPEPPAHWRQRAPTPARARDEAAAHASSLTRHARTLKRVVVAMPRPLEEPLSPRSSGGISRRNKIGLCLLNFLSADIRDGLAPFASVYLLQVRIDALNKLASDGVVRPLYRILSSGNCLASRSIG